MEGQGCESAEQLCREPSFSSYCSSTTPETAARVLMEGSDAQYSVDWDFEFVSLAVSHSNAIPVINQDVLFNEQVAARKPEGVVPPVQYKKCNSVGSLPRHWSLKGLLRRSYSVGASVKTNDSNIKEERKKRKEVGCYKFRPNKCPCKPIKPEKSKISMKRSSTVCDELAKRVFPVSEPEIVELDKSQRQEHDDSASRNVNKPMKVAKSKSVPTGDLTRRWSFKGFLRKSCSEREPPRSTSITEEGKEEKPSVFSRCFSLPSRSSSKMSLEGQELGSNSCMDHLFPCLILPADNSTQHPRETYQEKVAAKENKPSCKCSTGSGHHVSKNTSSTNPAVKVEGYKNDALKKYLDRKNAARCKPATFTPYRQQLFVLGR